MILKTLLVESVASIGLEEVEHEKELAGGRVAQVLEDGAEGGLEGQALALCDRHVQQYRLELDLPLLLLSYIIFTRKILSIKY